MQRTTVRTGSSYDRRIPRVAARTSMRGVHWILLVVLVCGADGMASHCDDEKVAAETRATGAAQTFAEAFEDLVAGIRSREQIRTTLFKLAHEHAMLGIEARVLRVISARMTAVERAMRRPLEEFRARHSDGWLDSHMPDMTLAALDAEETIDDISAGFAAFRRVVHNACSPQPFGWRTARSLRRFVTMCTLDDVDDNLDVLIRDSAQRVAEIHTAVDELEELNADVRLFVDADGELILRTED